MDDESFRRMISRIFEGPALLLPSIFGRLTIESDDSDDSVVAVYDTDSEPPSLDDNEAVDSSSSDEFVTPRSSPLPLPPDCFSLYDEMNAPWYETNSELESEEDPRYIINTVHNVPTESDYDGDDERKS